MTNIYLAGGISRSDWRHSIVDGLKSAVDYDPDNLGYYRDGKHIRQWPILHRSIFNMFNYTGPYFTSCDHGCFHGRNQHGVGAFDGGEETFLEYASDDEGNILVGDNGKPIIAITDIEAMQRRRNTVIKRCHSAIYKSDIFFLWVDKPDIYGSLVELGFASVMKKRIWIAFPEEQYNDDHWFAYYHAEKIREGRSAKECLAMMLGVK